MRKPVGDGAFLLHHCRTHMDDRANAEALRLIGEMVEGFHAEMREQARHLQGTVDRLRAMREHRFEAESSAAGPLRPARAIMEAVGPGREPAGLAQRPDPGVLTTRVA